MILYIYVYINLHGCSDDILFFFVIQLSHPVEQAYICDAAVDEVSGRSDTISGCWTSKGKKQNIGFEASKR